MTQVPNHKARQYVLKCEEFNGAKNGLSRNGYAISGRRVGPLYVVYSYGHWPMFMCDTRTDTWFVNGSRSSVTTSKHTSQCYPCGKNCAPLPADDLGLLIDAASCNL